MSDDYNPVCLHKGGQTYATRVGECCPICGLIRHRHSTLELVPIAEAGGIRVLTDVVVPIRPSRGSR
jgi:hypothetical protein